MAVDEQARDHIHKTKKEEKESLIIKERLKEVWRLMAKREATTTIVRNVNIFNIFEINLLY